MLLPASGKRLVLAIALEKGGMNMWKPKSIYAYIDGEKIDVVALALKQNRLASDMVKILKAQHPTAVFKTEEKE